MSGGRGRGRDRTLEKRGRDRTLETTGPLSPIPAPLRNTPPDRALGPDDAATEFDEPQPTLLHLHPHESPSEGLRRFRLVVAEGPEVGRTQDSSSDRMSIGSHPLNDLVVDEPTVSRFHAEIRIEEDGACLVDLRSRNGTIVDGVKVREAFLRTGSLLRIGRVLLRFEYGAERNRLPVSKETRFGSLVGEALASRQMFALLQRAATSDVTVLLEGETGTGKGKAAEALHQASSRKHAPFVVIDCSAIPANLLESELFGHEKGSFTGAEVRRIGAFEEANGGTVFLDEIGEMPTDLQPKLLRALESREIRRVGSNRFMPIDVRLIAATNRDLRAEVNAARFRSDLYYRLAVVKIELPPLRRRLEDLPLLVDAIIQQVNAPREAAARLVTPEFLAVLARCAWPGNVRELRNHIERSLVFEDGGLPEHASASADADEGPASSGSFDYAHAKKRAQDAFERRYLEELLRHFGGKVASAAEAAGVDRVYLYRLLRRHGMKAGEK